MDRADVKLKTLCVMRILMNSTDREHYMSAKNIADRLYQQYGFTTDRKSIYSDIDTLIKYGINIEKVPGNKGWYVNERTFKPAELKLLIDAVRAAKFISDDMTRKLIDKLKNLTSESIAEELHKPILFDGKQKISYDDIFSTINFIDDAIDENKKVEFQYVEWTMQKKLKLRHNGKFYEVSPWALVWDDENYYLLAYDTKIKGIKHYRVDKIRNIRVSDSNREGADYYKEYKTSFTIKTFGMYGGEDEIISLKCKNNMVSVIIDRFGLNPIFIPDGDEYFIVQVKVTLSPQFYGWITSMGNCIEIIRPNYVCEEYKKYLKNILKTYK